MLAMASLDAPQTWIPHVNIKDCSQGFCSLYCPQWCYIVSPPPPPFEFPDDDSSPIFSPLVIAIIGILASAFLLVCYYTIISKYCGNDYSARRRDQNHGQNEEFEDDHNSSLHEPWHAATTGVDEALIRSITVCKYKKGDGLIEGTDCSVCLSEFEEDESIRLLPKCSHAFHVPCIDTWLRSHSNCPLCRANIVFFSASLPQLPPPVTETPQGNESLQESQRANENVSVTQDTERVARDEQATQNLAGAPKTPSRVFSDSGNLEERDIIIEMRDIDRYQRLRRSFSMDHPCQSHTSIAEIIRMNQDEVVPVEGCSGDVGSSKHSAEISKCVSSSSRRVLHCVLNPVTMKRSFSSGRFFLTGHGRMRDTISLV